MKLVNKYEFKYKKRTQEITKSHLHKIWVNNVGSVVPPYGGEHMDNTSPWSTCTLTTSLNIEYNNVFITKVDDAIFVVNVM